MFSFLETIPPSDDGSYARLVLLFEKGTSEQMTVTHTIQRRYELGTGKQNSETRTQTSFPFPTQNPTDASPPTLRGGLAMRLSRLQFSRTLAGVDSEVLLYKVYPWIMEPSVEKRCRFPIQA